MANFWFLFEELWFWLSSLLLFDPRGVLWILLLELPFCSGLLFVAIASILVPSSVPKSWESLADDELLSLLFYYYSCCYCLRLDYHLDLVGEWSPMGYLLPYRYPTNNLPSWCKLIYSCQLFWGLSICLSILGGMFMLCREFNFYSLSHILHHDFVVFLCYFNGHQTLCSSVTYSPTFATKHKNSLVSKVYPIRFPTMVI